MGKKAKIVPEGKYLMSDEEVAERRKRTCFVGNLPLDCSTKHIKIKFQAFGKVEKVWFRSVATQMNSKVPLKGKIIMSEFGDQKDNKNAYVLFATEEEAKKAQKKLNQSLLGGKNIRVDMDYLEYQGKDPKDYDATLFVGNLPFVTNEQDLRDHFADVAKNSGAAELDTENDGIRNVRIVRDKVTHVGKGIAYIQFSSKQLMRLALELKQGK